jgi:Fic family protein
MKIPQTPPSFESHLSKLAAAEILAFIKKITVSTNGPYDAKGRYLHWEKVKHLAAPEGYDAEAFWLSMRNSRTQISKPLPFVDKHGQPFMYCMPDGVVRDLLWLEKHCSGSLVADNPLAADEQAKKTYLIGSLIEEAINSSQLEGASTTRRQAKELLKTGRTPKDHSEQMIFNNHVAMQFIREHKDDAFSPELIFKLHQLLTLKTLEAEDIHKSGNFRAATDDICVFSRDDQLLHVPPNASELPERLQRICDFANQPVFSEGTSFVPAIIKAIAVHFMLGYDHPFVDGNGRTARALFYWLVAKEGYWLLEYISISAVIKQAPNQYMQAYLYSETDGNDLTYFIIHQLEVIKKAVDNLYEYLARKSQQLKNTAIKLEQSKLKQQLNHRQLALLQHALDNPGAEYSFKSHQNSHGIVYQTARTDLLQLTEELKLLRKVKVGKADIFIAPADLAGKLF